PPLLWDGRRKYARHLETSMPGGPESRPQAASSKNVQSPYPHRARLSMQGRPELPRQLLSSWLPRALVACDLEAPAHLLRTRNTGYRLASPIGSTHRLGGWLASPRAGRDPGEAHGKPASPFPQAPPVLRSPQNGCD